MTYLNHDQTSQEGRQQGPWVCVPVQNAQNQSGLAGQIIMDDGSQQSVVCYPVPDQGDDHDQNSNDQEQADNNELLQDVLEQTGELLQQGEDQEGDESPALPDIFGPGGPGPGKQQGENQNQQEPPKFPGNFGPGAPQGKPNNGQNQGGAPVPPGMFAPGMPGGSPQGPQGNGQNQGGAPIPSNVFGPSGSNGQRSYGHPRAMTPHYVWVPMDYRYYYYW